MGEGGEGALDNQKSERDSVMMQGRRGGGGVRLKLDNGFTTYNDLCDLYYSVLILSSRFSFS